MLDPTSKTFQSLTTTSNRHTGELLAAALDVPYPPIQLAAVQALIDRGSIGEQLEAVARYPHFPHEIRAFLEASATSLVPAMRECLLGGSGEWAAPALELARAGEAYGAIEPILELLASDRQDRHEEAVQTLRSLVNRLYDHLHGHQESKSNRLKIAPQIGQITLTALGKSLAPLAATSHTELVIESILALGGPGHAIAENVLNASNQECRSIARNLLMTSRHPGVMRFVLESLSRTYPSPDVLKAVENRDDPEFVLAALRWVPERWTRTQEQNLRQIERIAWLSDGGEGLSWIPEELQPALIRFVSATGLPQEETLKPRVERALADMAEDDKTDSALKPAKRL